MSIYKNTHLQTRPFSYGHNCIYSLNFSLLGLLFALRLPPTGPTLKRANRSFLTMRIYSAYHTMLLLFPPAFGDAFSRLLRVVIHHDLRLSSVLLHIIDWIFRISLISETTVKCFILVFYFHFHSTRLLFSYPASSSYFRQVSQLIIRR